MSDKLDKAAKRFTRISCEILDHADHTINAINSGLGIIVDAENQARAERRASEFTNCPACHSGLVPFLKDTPHADHEAINAVVKNLWETCPDCIAEYTAYSENIPCDHGIRNWENCSECLDAWADAQYQECLDAEYGKACIESDAHDKATAEVMPNA